MPEEGAQQQGPDQFFWHGPVSGAEYPIVPVVDESMAPVVGVDVIERSVHLQNVLRLMPGINELGGFEKAAHTGALDEMRTRYGSGFAAVRANSEAKRQRLIQEAKEEFALASGLPAMAEHSDLPKSDIKQTVRAAFTELLEAYADPSKKEERDAELNKLVLIEFVTAQEKPLEAKPTDEEELPELTSLDKLRAVKEDERADFTPTNDREKIRALTLLDYVDNPDYEQGSVNQLDEVLYRKQKEARLLNDGRGGAKEGIRAMISITYEMGDYLTNAIESINGLRQVALGVRECPNPNVTLADEGLDELSPAGVHALIRHMDLQEFVRTGKVPERVSFPMIRTLEDRPDILEEETEQTNIPRKNKTLEDQYTQKEPSDEVAEYLKRRASEIKIGQIRKTVLEALVEQERRARFWEARVRETVLRSFAWRAGAVIVESLE